MRKSPTIEQARRIHAILTQVEVRQKEQHFSWGTPENGKEARELCYAISGYRPSKSDCFSCRVKVLDILRESVGLPPISRPVTHEKAESRMAICIQCPAYHPNTQSCGRLFLDAISPKPIMIDGELVNPCGCFLPLKTSIKISACPARKW